MEIKWNGQTIENLLVGTYLNTLCISLKEKELYVNKMEWADNRKSVGRNLLEYPVYCIKRERTFGGNGKMGKAYL